MEKQIQLSDSPKQIQITQYKHHENSVGNNLMTIQITTKYRYNMMQKEKLETFCRVSIEEACKKHKIEIKKTMGHLKQAWFVKPLVFRMLRN